MALASANVRTPIASTWHCGCLAGSVHQYVTK
jgi:hypothetical protein